MIPVSFHDLSATAVIPAQLLTRSVADLTSFCDRAASIIEAVRAEGDVALQRFARAYDGVTADRMSLRAEPEEFEAAIAFVNEYAPEHLELLTADPMSVLGRIRNAGEVLIGEYTPITLGNYVLGVNAVLPTGRQARTASPLSVFDFLKRISVGLVTRDGYPGLAADAECLAVYEGFSAHARAVSPLRRRLLGI